MLDTETTHIENNAPDDPAAPYILETSKVEASEQLASQFSALVPTDCLSYD
jgi:hypothetical protein